MRMYCKCTYSILCRTTSGSLRQFAALFCCAFLLTGRRNCGSVLCPSGFSPVDSYFKKSAGPGIRPIL